MFSCNRESSFFVYYVLFSRMYGCLSQEGRRYFEWGVMMTGVCKDITVNGYGYGKGEKKEEIKQWQGLDKLLFKIALILLLLAMAYLFLKPVIL